MEDLNFRNKKLTIHEFISDKKLKQFTFESKIFFSKHLPHNAYYGTVYLLKNLTIIEFCTMVTDELPDDPQYIEYVMFGHKMPPSIKTTVTFHTLNIEDFGSLKTASQLFKQDLISYNLDKTIDFMCALLKNDFKLYIKN